MVQADNINTIKCPFCKSENPDVSVCLTCGRKLGESAFDKIVGTLDLNRLISATLAIIYLIVATYYLGGKGFLLTLGFLVLPIGCIWYGDDLGNFTGTFLSTGITRPSAGSVVIFAGWLLLLLPIFQVIYILTW